MMTINRFFEIVQAEPEQHEALVSALSWDELVEYLKLLLKTIPATPDSLGNLPESVKVAILKTQVNILMGRLLNAPLPC